MSPHTWTSDGGRGGTPYEIRTGGRLPNGERVRTMFCAAYARVPPALRDGKLGHQALRCVHLGFARGKPGYLLEVLEGPKRLSDFAIFGTTLSY